MNENFPILLTDRLSLREITKDDVDALFAIHSDAEGMRWFGSDPIKTLDEAAKLVEIFAGWGKLPAPGIRWGVERNSDKKLIGTCGLFKWNRSWHVCTIGYELAQEARGKGFMTEALQAAIAWGLREMSLNRIEAQIYVENEPSIKLIQKLGFKYEGTLRQLGFWQQQYHDLSGYALLKEEWRVNASLK